MVGSVVALQQSNGLHDALPDSKQVLEYEKILRVRDEVLSGTHPRLKAALKTSGDLADKVISSTASSSSKAPFPTSNGIPISSSHPHAKVSTPKTSPPKADSAMQPPPTKNSNSSTFSAVQKGPSALDPIFLTKSDDLIRAEMKLERQRIERALEEQVQQRRLGTRQRISEQEALPDFDVNEVLQQAQELVKPILATDSIGANGNASSSDSFDENTFYSSQMNDSTGEDLDEPLKRRRTRPCRFFFEGSCRKGDECIYSHDPAFKQQMQAGGSLTMELDPTGSKQITDTYQSNGRPRRGSIVRDTKHLSETDNERGHRAEGDMSRRRQEGQLHNYQKVVEHHNPENGSDNRRLPYTRQGEDDIVVIPHNANQYQGGHFPQQTQLEANISSRPADSDLDATRIERRPSVLRNVQVVRNHITSPVAPQPARVSPLAVAKVPRLEQVRRIDQIDYSPRSGGYSSASNNSPLEVSQPTNSRKRRREPEAIDLTRNVSSRRFLESPGPYIKDEPMSPLPLSAHPIRQNPQRGMVGRQPHLVEVNPPRHREPVTYRHSLLDDTLSETANTRRVSTPVLARRVVSRTGEPHELRQDLDYRRIVSARQPSRNLSPQQDVHHPYVPQQRSMRAMSHTYATLTDLDQQRTYRASVQPPNHRYDRPDLSPELRPVGYAPIDREVQSMAPPPRRIVMDQYGNKYYEAPLPPDRRVVVSPASLPPQFRTVSGSVRPSMMTEDTFRKPAVRETTARRLTEPYNEVAYTQRAMSPKPLSPRYVEYRRTAEPVRVQRQYEPRDEVYRDQNGLVQVVDYAQDHPSQRYEEVPRAVSHMQSVRPTTSQYDLSREVPPRMVTVQPEQERIVDLGALREVRAPNVRHMSVRLDDRYERAPAYVSTGRPRYEYVSNPQDRYIDVPMEADDAGMEERREGRRQPLQRL